MGVPQRWSSRLAPAWRSSGALHRLLADQHEVILGHKGEPRLPRPYPTRQCGHPSLTARGRSTPSTTTLTPPS